MAWIETIGLIPEGFWKVEGQPKELEGDVFGEEAKWATLVELNDTTEGMVF